MNPSLRKLYVYGYESLANTTTPSPSSPSSHGLRFQSESKEKKVAPLKRLIMQPRVTSSLFLILSFWKLADQTPRSMRRNRFVLGLFEQAKLLPWSLGSLTSLRQFSPFPLGRPHSGCSPLCAAFCGCPLGALGWGRSMLQAHCPASQVLTHRKTERGRPSFRTDYSGRNACSAHPSRQNKILTSNTRRTSPLLLLRTTVHILVVVS